MSETHRSNQEIIGRDRINDVEAILAIPAVEGICREVTQGGSTMFTWDYQRTRTQLSRLYEKAKTSQWNGETDLDWTITVDQEAIANLAATHSPDLLSLRKRAEGDPDSPIHSWGDAEYQQLAFEQQSNALSQFLHGEQGALICTAKIVQQVPWIDAKYYASTQVIDEARHVEVFARYLSEKLNGEYPMNAQLMALIDDVIGDDRWDMTYLGMQVMIEGLALAAFGIMSQITPDPLLRKLLRYVMSDEARHVAFGVLSLREVYADMSASELRDRQEFAFEAGLRMRDRLLAVTLWERLNVDPAAMLRWQVATFENRFSGVLFSKIVPNVKKLGLLDAGDGWLRKKYEEMGVIQFEDWIDTSEEYRDLDEVAADRASVAS